MAMIVIQHPIKDFQAWKQAFDNDPLGRAKHGVMRHAIYRAADDPDLVIVNLEFATREQADRFLPMLRQMWDRVGGGLGFGSAQGVQARILDEVERT